METTTVIHPARSALSPFVPGVQRPEPFTLVLFGATGDLAARKLFPALFGLWQGGFLPEEFALVGVARRDKSDTAFRQEIHQAVAAFRPDRPNREEGFLAKAFYQRADFGTGAALGGLARRLQDLETEKKLPGHRLFYLATDPEHFGPLTNIVRHSARNWLSSLTGW